MVEASRTIAIVAEKPSVARDIARVVGAGQRGEGFLHGGGYVVTWAIGHLVQLAQPHEINPDWKRWRAESLPMLPREWPLVVGEQTKEQFDVVRKILTSPKVGEVICATDAGREGELIFRYIYEAAHCEKPVKRLWVSSLTPEAIRRGLETAKPGTEYDSLADAARGRSRADWLVGMNLSRAYTLAMNEELSVGRVQTPTLAMLVERELEIRAFVPEDYREVEATFSPGGEERYKGTWFRPGVEPLAAATRLPAEGDEAEQIVARAHTGKARIESLKAESQRMAPPLLYDLTELQRHANRLWGFSAQRTLEIAQALYERHKLISYPRTDSRHLSTEVAKTLPRIVAAIAGPYGDAVAPGTGERPLGRRYVDDAKVTDHHAIIPTPTKPGALEGDEQRVYDLVCRRLLTAWHADHVWAVTTVITVIRNGEMEDRYHSTGTKVEQAGWKVLDAAAPRKRQAKGEEGGDEGGGTLPPVLAEGQEQTVVDAEAKRKKTRAPKRFTEATLLTAMETAGKTLDEKELSEAMKDSGLGTPATRAAIIEILLKRGYVEREGKTLAATEKGIRLVEVVHPEVKSPAMTGQWEARLEKIHRGAEALPPFLEGIERYVEDVVGKVKAGGVWKPRVMAAAAAAETTPMPEPRSSAGMSLEQLLHERFGFAAFRPHQEEVCKAVIRGDDGLLVMPTGAGKSLCYQLPGVARGGTTVVISPLIALMEDQASKLRRAGFRADRIHSGRDRAASRQACTEYLSGGLDFLFIAPERLRVQGFPEMLGKRKPALVAIDEAHCISQWGHDFRPDYRMIGQYLPLFRPAPVLALTATATAVVQEDIIGQLGLRAPRRFIHGFRRENLAIEVVEAAQSRRAALAAELLQEEGRLPAIVYVPTRRAAESLAGELSALMPAAAYHAGLEPGRRDDVQTRFLGGKLRVIVATIAFGMGIDKPDIRTVIHTAMPGSLEGYYQEIGRAGRDGLPSRAILMQSYSDRHTHDYFFERDYPETSVLRRIAGCLSAQPAGKEELSARAHVYGEEFDNALEKLWIHGGALIDYAENVTAGSESWEESYELQRRQREIQIEQVLRFAEGNQCRMHSLVRHFGDRGDTKGRCGICDFCAPGECLAQEYRAAKGAEEKAAQSAVAALKKLGSVSTGRLHTEAGGEGAIARRDFEKVLGGMARAGWLELTDATFEKDGRRIDYRKAALTQTGRALEAGAALEFAIAESFLASRKGRRKPVRERASKRKKAGKEAAAPRVKESGAARDGAGAAKGLVDALKAWRLAEAKRKGVPAFRIMTDKTLQAIAEQQPRSTAELLAVPGMGLRAVEQYGSALFEVMRRAR